MNERKAHPSGRPIQSENRRDWKYGPYVEHGFRNWRLNPQDMPRIRGATDLHAIGFIDWEARQAADAFNDIEVQRGRK